METYLLPPKSHNIATTQDPERCVAEVLATHNPLVKSEWDKCVSEIRNIAHLPPLTSHLPPPTSHLPPHHDMKSIVDYLYY